MFSKLQKEPVLSSNKRQYLEDYSKDYNYDAQSIRLSPYYLPYIAQHYKPYFRLVVSGSTLPSIKRTIEKACLDGKSELQRAGVRYGQLTPYSLFSHSQAYTSSRPRITAATLAP